MNFDESSDGSLNTSRNSIGEDVSFRARIERAKDGLRYNPQGREAGSSSSMAASLLSREVGSSSRLGASPSASRYFSGQGRMYRSSLGGGDDDMLERTSSSRTTSSRERERDNYTSLLSAREMAKDKEISELRRKVSVLEEHNNSLVKGLVSRTDAAHNLQDENGRIRAERDEAVSLFEDMTDRVNALEDEVEARARQHEESMASLEDENEMLMREVSAYKDKMKHVNALESALIDRDEDMRNVEEEEVKARRMCLELKEQLAKSEEEVDKYREHLEEALKELKENSAPAPGRFDSDKETWEGVCADLQSQLLNEKTTSSGLRHKSSMHSIELSFKEEEVSSLRAELEREKEKLEAQREEVESLNGVVDDLKATMESRVREIVSEASELSGELSGSKEVISSLEKRMEAEKARMTSRIQSLESRNKLLSVEASDLKQRCSDRDQIMSYTLQRLVKMSEVCSDEQKSAWACEAKQLRDQLALQAARELADESKRKQVMSNAPTEPSTMEGSEQSTGTSFDSASVQAEAAIFQGEDGLMVTTKAMQGRKRRRASDDVDQGEVSPAQAGPAKKGGWFGGIFGGS